MHSRSKEMGSGLGTWCGSRVRSGAALSPGRASAPKRRGVGDKAAWTGPENCRRGHLSGLADPRACQGPGWDIPYCTSPQIRRDRGRGNGFPTLPGRGTKLGPPPWAQEVARKQRPERRRHGVGGGGPDGGCRGPSLALRKPAKRWDRGLTGMERKDAGQCAWAAWDLGPSRAMVLPPLGS